MDWQVFRRRPDLDDDGQPVNRDLNADRRHDRAADESLGWVKGILADGVVLPAEIEEFARWLAANVEDPERWPFCDLLPRMQDALADGDVNEGECEDLAALFRHLVAVQGVQRPSSVYVAKKRSGAIEMANYATELPLTRPEPHPLEFTGKCYVFTGRFFFGERSQCQFEVTKRGGRFADNVSSKTDVLVIGQLGSRDWVHTSYGRKIERAAELARQGSGIQIVCEEHWRRFIL